MTKNIIVSDNNNQTLGKTYIKRANQLVKKGRAKWINELHIQLEACPPNNQEDMNMNLEDNIFINEKSNTSYEGSIDNLDKCIGILQKMSDETTGLSGILNGTLDKLPEDQRSNALKDILAIIEQAEVTKRQIVAAIDTLFKVTQQQDDSIVGRYENGRVHRKILEYYRTNGGESIFGEPADNGGSEYVHKWGDVIVQDFDGGIYDFCNIMTGKAGTFLLKGVFRDKYLSDRGENYLKAPTSEEYETERGLRQDFEGGYMLYEPDTDDIMIYTKMQNTRRMY